MSTRRSHKDHEGQVHERQTPARRFRHRRGILGVVVCAGKRTYISQDTWRRNRRAVAFGDIPLKGVQNDS